MTCKECEGIQKPPDNTPAGEYDICSKCHRALSRPIQEKLFSDEEVIQRDWNKKFPCPKCEVGKLEYSETDDYSYISCFKCHWTWRREQNYKEARELTGRYGGGKAD